MPVTLESTPGVLHSGRFASHIRYRIGPGSRMASGECWDFIRLAPLVEPYNTDRVVSGLPHLCSKFPDYHR